MRFTCISWVKLAKLIPKKAKLFSVPPHNLSDFISAYSIRASTCLSISARMYINTMSNLVLFSAALFERRRTIGQMSDTLDVSKEYAILIIILYL